MRALIVVFAVVAALAAPARAEPLARVVTERADTVLAAETDGVAPGGRLDLVFHQKLKEGWHVYWRNPGDSGLPLEFRWTLPDGFSAGVIAYPPPQRIPLPPLVNYGHTGAPTFRVAVQAPPDARVGDVASITLEATWLICADICVPETGVFALAAPIVAEPQPVAQARALGDAARAADPAAFAGEATFAIEDGRIYLALSPAPASGGYFFPYAEGLIEPSAVQRARLADGRLIIAMEGASGLGAVRLRSLDGVVVADGGEALALSAAGAAEPLGAAFAAAAPARPAIGGGVSAGLIAAAFFGGALLNLMPCVFPILFIKAAHLAHGAAAGRARRDGVFYAAGVIATFVVLGGLFLALRAAGESVGWGFHLQSPAAVLASAYALFLVALNLLGVFSVGESLVGVGPAQQGRGDAGAFLAGALAVFVSAPCIGPFLTAPVGAAAVAPAGQAMAIFVAMGAGLAAPFAILAAAPALARRLPKPGAWMVSFRRWLAVPVLLAAGYFLWVLFRQSGEAGVAAALAGAGALGLAAFAFEQAKAHTGGARTGWRAAALAGALAGLGVGAAGLDGAPAERTIAPLAGVETIAFDPHAVEARRAAGQGVFLDFTAAWCVTCQVNKLTVFSDASVLAAFRDKGVAFAVADWTRRDAAIAEALAGYGAAGVPLNVYLPARGDPVIFDQPLSSAAVKEALARSPPPTGTPRR